MLGTSPTAWTLALLTLVACTAAPRSAEGKGVEQLTVKVLAEYPHARDAFTQGLVWGEGVLFESTGQYGASTLRRVDPETGHILAQHDLDSSLFGEGLVLRDGRLIQLTWKAGLALVYDAESLLPMAHLPYRGEGWGLALAGDRLVMSDGTSRLTFRDPETFETLSTLDVTLDGKPVRFLNELEFVDGHVWANVWQTDRIMRIDPATGKVTAVVDASQLLSPMEKRGAGVLNGIAYDADSASFWLTGKNWPWMFQVTFEPATEAAAGSAP